MTALTLDTLLADYPEKEAEDFMRFLAYCDPSCCSGWDDPVSALEKLEGHQGADALERVASAMLEHIVKRCRKRPNQLHRLFATRVIHFFDCDGQEMELGEKTLLLLAVAMNPSLLTTQKRASLEALRRDYIACYVLLRFQLDGVEPSGQELNRALLFALDHCSIPYSPASYEGTSILKRMRAAKRYKDRLHALSLVAAPVLKRHFSQTLAAMAEIGQHRHEYKSDEPTSLVSELGLSTSAGWSSVGFFDAVRAFAQPKRNGRPARGEIKKGGVI